MKLKYDRPIVISVGTSRKDIDWKRQEMRIGELWDRISQPIRSTEALAEYLRMTKNRQDDLKDVGGFVGGTLDGPRRKQTAVTGRDIVSLDFDTIVPYGTRRIIDAVGALCCASAIYSTRKHAEHAPRLRVLVPLDRTAAPDEYEPVARWIASQIDMQAADPTTFEVHRLMYWPSCCSDGQFVFQFNDAPLLSCDAILETYRDWRDVSSWPAVPGADAKYRKLAMKQGDPEAKEGLIGAFCRTYDVIAAMDAFLPGIYAPVENDENRYTYLGGSTTGGAVIYDHAKFLYSHHATDPCSGRLVNAFDLVRLHKFGDMDDKTDPTTSTNKLPSFKAMSELAAKDKTVQAALTQERMEKAKADFEGVQEAEGTEQDGNQNWVSTLEYNTKGQILQSINNCRIILENDEDLKGKFAYNSFAARIEVNAKLPWSRKKTVRAWEDSDISGLYWFMENTYGITKRASVDAAMDLYVQHHAFNDVEKYLSGLRGRWDGVERLDRLFIDYLGAEDDEDGYTRAVSRKIFTAAVRRALRPGCKFDCMVILCGPQGVGKSTIIDRMSRGWYNDSIRTFEGKDASELLQGVWLVEVAELDAFRRTDVSRIKQFLSLRYDRYRAAYGRTVQELPRCCVFFGTCNQSEFLQDTTGNRRFWPVDVGKVPHEKTVFRDLTPEVVDQIWAEAIEKEPKEELFLQDELFESARSRQEEHRESSTKEGFIMDFLEKLVPADWDTWDIDRRLVYWGGGAQGEYTLVRRRKVCAVEIWCELFGKNKADIKKTDAAEINAILSQQEGWERTSTARCGPYGRQRAFNFKGL